MGKVPPQAVELEEAMLGAVLMEPRSYEEISDIIRDPDTFYKPMHVSIYSAMQRIVGQGRQIDLLTIAEELKKSDELEIVGGPYYLAKLTQGVASSAHIVSHARILIEKYTARKIIETANTMLREAYEPANDVFAIIDTAEKEIFNLSMSQTGNEPVHIAQTLQEVSEEVTTKLTNKIESTGVPSGFKFLDTTTNGWQPTDLIILAARPAVGKTAFALNLALNAAKAGNPVAFFSLEMSNDQLAKRLISCVSEVPLHNVNSPMKMSSAEVNGFYRVVNNDLAKIPLYLDDTAGLTTASLRSKCRRLKKKKDLKLIIIDYLQLMQGQGGNREQEVAKISRELKMLAKELKVPIIALSQLSRAVEARAEKRPGLADLRESGAIEQDADIVMMFYRPVKEQIDRDPRVKDANIVDIVKHRNGALDSLPVFRDLSIQKFYNEPPPAKFEASGDFISNKAINSFHSRNEDDLPF